MRDHYDHNQKRWVWRCDCCQKVEHWDDEWMFYGSIMDAEHNQGVATCSEACRAEIIAKGKAPAMDDKTKRYSKPRVRP